jgi:hypothetical protein
MTAEKLKPGVVLRSRTSKTTRTVEDSRPADGASPRTWLVNGHWLNYAQVDARYTLPGEKKKQPAHLAR